jgi:hypothetical protein
MAVERSSEVMSRKFFASSNENISEEIHSLAFRILNRM